MPLNRAEGFDTTATTEGVVENPNTPASEPARSQPASPTKKRRKVSRSQSIPAQPSNSGGLYPPPNVYAPQNDHMGIPPSPYDDPMQHPGSTMHMSPHMGPGAPPGPHQGHPMMHGGSSMPPYMHHSHMQQHPGSPHSLGAAGHPMSHPHLPAGPGGRYMRQSSAPMAPPHMSPHNAGLPPGHLHPPQGISPQMGGHMTPGAPVGPGAPPGTPPVGLQQQYSPGMAPGPMASRVYPSDKPMILNQSNPHAPPIYPCGICHKEINDSDQAILCEVGCNLWFHRFCTGLSELAFQHLTTEPWAVWSCDPCITNKKIPPIIVK